MRRFFLVGCLIGAASLATSGCGKPNFRPETATSVQVAQVLPEPGVGDILPRRIVTVGPGDLLQISVFGLPELDRKVRVDDRGNLTYPLAGSLEVLGRTSSEIESQIAERLAGRYVRDPQVTVLVTENLSQRVVVGGAVRMPGLYPVTGDATLSQAIALANGVSEVARLKEVVVFRTVGAQRYAARFNLADIYGGRSEDPQVYPNDRIVVGSDQTRGLLRDLAPLTPLLGIFYQII